MCFFSQPKSTAPRQMHGGTFGRLKALCFSGFYSSSNLNEKVMSVKEARLGEMRVAQFDQGLCAFFKCVVTLPEAALTSYAKTDDGNLCRDLQ